MNPPLLSVLRPSATAVVLSLPLFVALSCGSDESNSNGPGVDPNTTDASEAQAEGGPASEGGEAGKADAPAGDGPAAEAKSDVISPQDGASPLCGCLLGEGPYCGKRAAEEAANAGCKLDLLATHENDLLKCENNTWSVLEACKSECKFDGSSTKLDDACFLPVCDCFVQVAWCGSGAAKEAATLGCRIPLLPEHNGDILFCPEGQWSVKQSCALGCVEAPKGTPDYCKSDSEYRLPFDCNTSHTCSNGNNTSSHSGKDEYAYDFAMPVGTTLRASRAGTVLRVRLVSEPGDGCYDGGGSSCANYANTVEVLHSDSTVALYMHLSSISVTQGQPVDQGTILGKSGNSGWSTGPHLHTQIQDNCGIWWCQSIPFKYAEDSSISAGTSVTSQNCP